MLVNHHYICLVSLCRVRSAACVGMIDIGVSACYVVPTMNGINTELLQAANEISETIVRRDGDKYVARTRDLRYVAPTNHDSLSTRASQLTVSEWIVSRSDTADDALRCVLALAACGYGDPAKIARLAELTAKHPPNWRKDMKSSPAKKGGAA